MNLKNSAMDLHGLFQARVAALALTEDLKSVSEVVLRHRPVKRGPHSGSNLKGSTVGLLSLF